MISNIDNELFIRNPLVTRKIKPEDGLTGNIKINCEAHHQGI